MISNHIREVALLSKRVGLPNQYFYLCRSLLIAAVVVYGFGQEIDQRFLHPSHPKPLLLSIHP